MSAQPESAALQRPTAFWAGVIAALGLVLILLATLLPSDFRWENLGSATTPILAFDLRLVKDGMAVDIVGNILLFFPAAFGLAGLVACRTTDVRMLLVVIVSAAVLSFAIEALQQLLPLRDTALLDVLTNTLGALCGALAFRSLGKPLLGRLDHWAGACYRHLTRRRLYAGLASYTLLLLVLMLSLGQQARLAGWDIGFPLILGNEPTGDRPWEGTIAYLALADQAISSQQAADLLAGDDAESIFDNTLVALYRFGDDGVYRDLMGNLPEFYWQGNSTPIRREKVATLSAEHWLQTRGPAAPLTTRISTNGQFSLAMTVATADEQQEGPARIVSLSADPYQRNLTIGQKGNTLVVRIRTPHTGPGGTLPELVVPRVFNDTHEHHVIVTYAASTLRVYIDRPQRHFEFTLAPEYTLLSPLTPIVIRSILIDRPLIRIYRPLAYSLVFFPLGVLLALAASRTPWSALLPLIGTVATVPTLALEIGLAQTLGRPIEWGNILLGMALPLTIGLVLSRQWYRAGAAWRVLAGQRSP